MITCDQCHSKIKNQDSITDCDRCRGDYCTTCIVQLLNGEYVCGEHTPKCYICLQRLRTGDSTLCRVCDKITHSDCAAYIHGYIYCKQCVPKCVECSAAIADNEKAIRCWLCHGNINNFVHKKCSGKLENTRYCKKHYNLEKDKADTSNVIYEYIKQFWKSVGLAVDNYVIISRGLYKGGLKFSSDKKSWSWQKLWLNFKTEPIINNNDEIVSLKHTINGIANCGRTYVVTLLNHDNMAMKMRLGLIRSARSKKAALTQILNRYKQSHRKQRTSSLRAQQATMKGRLNLLIKTLVKK